MLRVFLRTKTNNLLSNWNGRIISSSFRLDFYKNYMTARDITERAYGESGSLSTRFIKYIALTNCKFDPIIPQNIKYSAFYPVTNIRDFQKLIMQIETNQIPRLILYTYTYKTNGDPIKVAEIINEIDKICIKRLDVLDINEILRIMYAFMYLIPNKITKLGFYTEGVKKLVTSFDTTLSKEHFVQVSHYLGFWKRNPISTPLMKQFLENFIPNYTSELSKLDFAIVCNAAYKTSTIIDNKEFQNRLVVELLSTNLLEDGLLITFVKSLRLNRVKSDEIYKKLKVDLTHSEKLQFKGLAHIFACFAEGLWNEEETCNIIVKCLKERLEDVGSESALHDVIRAKDLATFIWSCSYLQIDFFKLEDFKFFEEIILRKIENDEYTYYPDALVDTCLSMWMLNYKSKDLIHHLIRIFENKIPKRPTNERVKLNSRYKLLMVLVQLENPEWLNKYMLSKENPFLESRKAPNYLVKTRYNLQKIYNILDESKQILNIKNVEIVLQIQELNVPGIFVEMNDERKCFVEVLEDNQKLSFNNTPTAMFSLKVKLLENLGCRVIMMDTQKGTSNEELLEKVKIELNNVTPILNSEKIAV